MGQGGSRGDRPREGIVTDSFRSARPIDRRMDRLPADPPRSLGAVLAQLGPGLVLAAAVVGSGELIATTRVGAEAGFALLWLILIGCTVKVAAQVEIGRVTLTRGRTPLVAFDAVPGPRFAGRNWIFWSWAAMTALIVVQQGGIVAGVAQTLAAGLPLTRSGAEWNRVHDELAAVRIAEAAAVRTGADGEARALGERRGGLEATRAALPAPVDTAWWCVVVAAVAAAVLGSGRYAVVERLSVALVVVFVAITLTAVVLLQFRPAWAITSREFAAGLVPSLPPARDGRSPLPTALAAFGIIGVGASELMFYPYWCLAKGYGRAVGPRDESPAWAARARGWLRVLRADAWASLAVYTVVTLAFYLLGAATLGRIGLIPEGGDMIRSLAAMYAPVFGGGSNAVFLVGGFAVLFSTLVAAADGNSRIIADGLALAGLVRDDEAARAAWSRRIAVAWILAALVLALVIREPVAMVLASGLAQAIMLAAIGVAVLHFRHREIDPRLAPGRAWDAVLWLSAAALIAVGGWTAWQQVVRLATRLAE